MSFMMWSVAVMTQTPGMRTLMSFKAFNYSHQLSVPSYIISDTCVSSLSGARTLW